MTEQEHELKVTKIGDSTYLNIKIKHLIISFSTLLTLLGAAVGWIMKDYTSEFQVRDKRINKMTNTIEKFEGRLNEINGNVMFIRGQLGNVVLHNNPNNFDNIKPEEVNLPNN